MLNGIDVVERLEQWAAERKFRGEAQGEVCLLGQSFAHAAIMASGAHEGNKILIGKLEQELAVIRGEIFTAYERVGRNLETERKAGVMEDTLETILQRLGAVNAMNEVRRLQRDHRVMADALKRIEVRECGCCQCAAAAGNALTLLTAKGGE